MLQGKQAGNSAWREAVGTNRATECAKIIHLTYSPLSQTAAVGIAFVQRDTEEHCGIGGEIVIQSSMERDGGKERFPMGT